MSGWGKKVGRSIAGVVVKIVFLLSVLLYSSAFSQTAGSQATSWKETLKNKKGSIIVYWNPIKPIIYKNSANQLVGIEVDLMEGFQEYLKSQHEIEINLIWKEIDDFRNVYNIIKNSRKNGIFGASSFSILENRIKEVGFSPAYLKDISIIVSKNGVPTISTRTDFYSVFKGFTALSSSNTTYEKNLLRLKQQHSLLFDIEYINNTGEIVKLLSSEKEVFAYLELPSYLTALNEGLSVKRHHFAPVVRDGYAFIYSLGSDWKEPVEAYFNQVNFQHKKDQIISKYLGLDVLHLIQQIDSDDTIGTVNEVTLLIKEKEIQERELNKATLKQQEQVFFRNLLILGLLFIITVATVLFYINRQKAKTNQTLVEQQKQIEKQQEAIAGKNKSLAKNNKKLKRLNNQKNDLIGVLSHDLRAPVNQIKGFAEIYKMENNNMSEGQNELIDRIISTSDRLNAMIRKIMDIEAIDSNKISLNIERLNLSELLKDISTSFGEIAKNKNINITTNIEAEDLHIEADQTYLTQVFENLVSNAIKFSKSDKTVEIKLHPSEGKVQAMIKDQGPGLTSQDQKNLFKKYQKLSATPTAGEQSTGLGLSIVKEYVKRMKGKVWAESTEGEGSTFIVEFDKVA